jgi:hypothetical protein
VGMWWEFSGDKVVVQWHVWLLLNSLFEVAIGLGNIDGVLYVCRLHGVFCKSTIPTNKSTTNKNSRH